MALWDREACGNAADFLRLGLVQTNDSYNMSHTFCRGNFKSVFRDAELLTLRNTPFDGRKCIWVPSKDEEVSYAPATIIGEGSKVGFSRNSDWLSLNEF